MQYSMLIYESEEDFDARTDETRKEKFRSAWLADHKAREPSAPFVDGI